MLAGYTTVHSHIKEPGGTKNAMIQTSMDTIILGNIIRMLMALNGISGMGTITH